VPVCIGLILFAGRIATFLKRSPRAMRLVDWAFATVLGAFAVRLALIESR
jgi:threonine/homoserine/homoserine lactone efflux protein